MNAKTAKSFVALISTGSIGSWAKEKTEAEAIERCKRIFIADWRTTLKLAKGQKLKVGVYDTSGMDVHVDIQGVCTGERGEINVPLLKTIEVTV